MQKLLFGDKATNIIESLNVCEYNRYAPAKNTEHKILKNFQFFSKILEKWNLQSQPKYDQTKVSNKKDNE